MGKEFTKQIMEAIPVLLSLKRIDEQAKSVERLDHTECVFTLSKRAHQFIIKVIKYRALHQELTGFFV